MIGLIERRANKVVHGGVDDDEVFGVAFLHINDFRNQDASIAGDQSTRLGHDLQAGSGRRATRDCGHIHPAAAAGCCPTVIGDAKAAAEIDVLNRVRRRLAACSTRSSKQD
jgi:hypothetical protein